MELTSGWQRPITAEEKLKIYDLMFRGISLVEVCKTIGVQRQAVWEEGKRDPAFAAKVKEIREESAHDLVDMLRNITIGCETMVDVNVARLKSDNAKWEASKRNPSVYGERLEVNVQTLDLTAVLNAASSRVLPMLQARQPNSRVVEETIALADADHEDALDDLI